MLSRLTNGVLCRRYCTQPTNNSNKDGVYTRVLKKYPLLMQAVQTGILMGSGDIIAQYFVEDKRVNQIDLKRTSQFAGMGFLVVSYRNKLIVSIAHSSFLNNL